MQINQSLQTVATKTAKLQALSIKRWI